MILVVNHIHLDSPLEYATATLLSAAEVLVAISGVVAGMVFGRRWQLRGWRTTIAMLLVRARTLYVATVVVIALVGALVAVPQIPTGAVTASPGMPPGTDLRIDQPLDAGPAAPRERPRMCRSRSSTARVATARWTSRAIGRGTQRPGSISSSSLTWVLPGSCSSKYHAPRISRKSPSTYSLPSIRGSS